MFTEEQKKQLVKSRTDIIGIAAVNTLGYIGLSGNLVVRNKEDMQEFVRVSKGTVLVMGRTTFESCRRPLLGRSVCVLTSNKEKAYRDAQTFTELQQLVAHIVGYQHVYIAGGAEIYKLFEDVYTGFSLTELYDKTKGDVRLPIDIPTGLKIGTWRYDNGRNIKHGRINQYTKVLR